MTGVAGVASSGTAGASRDGSTMGSDEGSMIVDGLSSSIESNGRFCAVDSASGAMF